MHTNREPFNRLVKLAARAFYDDITKGDHQPRTGRSDNRGIAVVVLDALTRREWVKEENLAKDLKLHSKQLRRTLRFFEEEKLIARDHRKETSKVAKIHNAAVAATTDGQSNGREGESKEKLHTHSYCCLDYAQIYDIVRYRIHRMKKKIKDEMEDKNTVQEYICPNCSKRYTALDALRLISEEDDNFHCERCNGELVAESDKLAAEEMGDGDDNARKRRREKLKDMLERMETQLKPLMDQLTKVKDLQVPELRTLFAWERDAYAAGRANGDSSSNDPSRSSQGFSGTPMPYLGETKVEVAFSGDENKEDIKPENSSPQMKVLPPWMIREGMNLTKEQRGEFGETKMGGPSAGFPEDKKSISNKDNATSLQDEYIKAYYAALLQRQQEQDAAAKGQEELLSNATSNGTVERQVGMKSKRDENEGDEDVEWEEAPPAGNTGGIYKVDLNVEAAEVSGEEEDDIDWEEG